MDKARARGRHPLCRQRRSSPSSRSAHRRSRLAARPHARAPPPPAPGALARLLGKRSPPLEAAALVIDTVDEPAPVGLLAWLADLGTRDIDLSWIGNESGPGLVHTIAQPLREGLDVRAALLSHAREHAELVALVREHAEVWLEDGGGVPVEEGRLVQDDPAHGWIEDLELETIIEGIEGHAGA